MQLPGNEWKATLLREDGSVLREARLRARESDGALRLNWEGAPTVRLAKTQAAMLKSNGFNAIIPNLGWAGVAP